MAKTTIDSWDAGFFRQSAMFEPVAQAAAKFSACSDWPTLDLINQLFESKQQAIRAVPQAGVASCFEEQYEPRIYLKSELQTRSSNWHDFFNALVWLQFSKTKRELNRLHYYEALQRDEKTNRSRVENAIALFDECGCIIISSDQSLLDLIRNHQWYELFVERRESFFQDIECYIFGHAMFEKALNPYIGMTCQAILIHSEQLLNAELTDIDQQLAQLWQRGDIRKPAHLFPFPVLGVPGWYEGEQSEHFYRNTDYFRPRREE
ncbi:MAG: DUF3025 domain-containing protein [Gammaproteobacteria bacterium]